MALPVGQITRVLGQGAKTILKDYVAPQLIMTGVNYGISSINRLSSNISSIPLSYQEELISKPIYAMENLGNWYIDKLYTNPWERNRALMPNFGGNFSDTQQAATLRQRALQEMQSSHINARSVLGSEARTYHRSGSYRLY